MPQIINRSSRSSGHHARGAFTLIEMLIVLVVLAAVAALVVPTLGFVEEQSGHATAATTSAQLVSNLETYKSSTGSYPLGMDSLIDDTGAIYDGLWEHVNPSFGPVTYLEVADASPYAQSIGHVFEPNAAGEEFVYDHDSTSADPNNSATIKRLLTGAYDLAFVKAYAPGPPPAPMLLNWYKAAGYPDGTLPAGTRLIALGVGPLNSAVGETLSSVPAHAEQDSDVYGRYIAIFAVHEDGRSAKLRTVVDSQGVPIGQNIDSYRNNGAQLD